MVARDEKHGLFKRRQESARKNVERALSVLQGRWRIKQQPAGELNELYVVLTWWLRRNSNAYYGLMGNSTLQGCTVEVEPMGEIGPEYLIKLNICGRNPAGEIMWSLDGPRRPDDVGDGADDEQQAAAAAAEEAGLRAPTGIGCRKTTGQRIQALYEEIRRLRISVDAQREELEMFRIMYAANAVCDSNYVEFTRECDEQRRLMSRLLEQEPPETVKKFNKRGGGGGGGACEIMNKEVPDFVMEHADRAEKLIEHELVVEETRVVDFKRRKKTKKDNTECFGGATSYSSCRRRKLVRPAFVEKKSTGDGVSATKNTDMPCEITPFKDESCSTKVVVESDIKWMKESQQQVKQVDESIKSVDIMPPDEKTVLPTFSENTLFKDNATSAVCQKNVDEGKECSNVEGDGNVKIILLNDDYGSTKAIRERSKKNDGFIKPVLTPGECQKNVGEGGNVFVEVAQVSSSKDDHKMCGWIFEYKGISAVFSATKS
ncbi:ALP1-like protein [Tanacetum coccineum]|uniref:ALP1-like protein n=1 Tax=Tanacetum coccineum TaxID=301880 RepID=A0ABQ5BKC7_9ASTR